ncbi:MAG: S8 family serine peptidase [Anaerolineae bacterium]
MKGKIQRKTLIGILLAGGVLLVGIAAGVYFLIFDKLRPMAQGPNIAATLAALEDQDLTPPSSIGELADEYPELAPLLTDPELGSIYKEFLVAYQEGGIEAATALAQERGLLTPDGESLRVTLVLDTEDHQPLVDQLTPLGVEVVSAYRDRVNIAVPVVLIEASLTSDQTATVFEELTELEHVIAIRLPDQRVPDQQSQEGEGIGAMGAEAWHAAGLTGTGLRVGVLDLGFAGYEALLGVELPEAVEMATFGWYDSSEVHGTACAEIVHEVAPGAELFFAWYDGSDAAMGEAVDWLIDKSVDIISHSAGGVVSPRDGSGWDARLVDELSEAGVLWINSAGNEAEGHYRDVFFDEDGDGFHEFQPGVSLLPIETGGFLRVFLIWQESWDNPTQDYELVLFNGDGEVIAAAEDAQNGESGQQPAEGIILETEEDVVYAGVYAYDVDRSVVFDIFAQGPGAAIHGAVPEYSVSSPADAMSALTVGAVDWNSDVIASYSSNGPTTDERLKPEVSGPTGVSGATYGRYGFDGTSASTPHVAGAAALIWEAYPGFSREDVVDFLLAAVEDLGPVGPDTAYGFGRLILPPPPNAVAEAPPPSATSPPDEPTPRPTPRPTSTPVTYVTPVPTEEIETDEDEGGLGLLVVMGLVVGGLGLGGTGLLVIGGVLLLGRRRGGHQEVDQDHRPPVPASAVQPVQGSRSTYERKPDPSLPRTELWLGSDVPEVDRGRPKDQPPVRSPGAGLVRCPVCNAPAQSNDRFCASCGAEIPSRAQSRFCRHCGAPLRDGSRFCGKCGKPVAGSS